jgi:hypothetical protein
MEMDVGPVHRFLGRIDPLKNPAGHCESRCRHIGCRTIEPGHHFGKSPVGRLGVGIDLKRPYAGPGHFRDSRFGDNRFHRTDYECPVGTAVQQGSRDHIARSAMKRIKNQDTHLQYL